MAKRWTAGTGMQAWPACSPGFLKEAGDGMGAGGRGRGNTRAGLGGSRASGGEGGPHQDRGTGVSTRRPPSVVFRSWVLPRVAGGPGTPVGQGSSGSPIGQGSPGSGGPGTPVGQGSPGSGGPGTPVDKDPPAQAESRGQHSCQPRGGRWPGPRCWKLGEKRPDRETRG